MSIDSISHTDDAQRQRVKKMESALFFNIQSLFDHGLYECVIQTASLLRTLLKNNRNMEMEYQTLLYLSHSNFEERNYRIACNQLEAAVLQRKPMQRIKGSFLTDIERSYPQFQEVEMRCKIAICYRELGEYSLAISTLQLVKTRTPRLNMLLGKLLHHQGSGVSKKEKAQIFKDVLRDCPMSLTAIESLLELGIDGSEVNSLVMNAATLPGNIEWLSTWIKGHAQLYGCKHREAAQTFQQLNDSVHFRHNEQLLTKIGQCFYYYGKYVQAEQYLKRAVMVNPHNMNALCPLSVVYFYNKKDLELNVNVPLEHFRTKELSSSHWFLHAQLCYAKRKYNRSLIFTERALDIDSRNIEALLLRGNLFNVLGRHREAISIYQNAQFVAPYRFEVYKGMVGSYIQLGCLKEAQAVCEVVIRKFPTSPRSYTMLASTLYRMSNFKTKRSAKSVAEKAFEIDAHYAPAVALIATMYKEMGSTMQAIELVKKHVAKQPNAKLFAILGDLLSADKNVDAALQFYTNALRMDSKCQRALNGINGLNTARSSASGIKTEKPASPATPAAAATVATAEASSVGRTAAAASPAAAAVCNVSTMTRPCGEPDLDCPQELELDDTEMLELSSPAGPPDDADSDTFSEPFWQDVDGELPN